jgi:hypothetical protein
LETGGKKVGDLRISAERKVEEVADRRKWKKQRQITGRSREQPPFLAFSRRDVKLISSVRDIDERLEHWKTAATLSSHSCQNAHFSVCISSREPGEMLPLSDLC